MNQIKTVAIPLSKEGFDKSFIEPFLHLQTWDEIVGTCSYIDSNIKETVIVLKFKNKKVCLHLAPGRLDLDFLCGMVGNEIAILKTEDCFLIQKITYNQKVSDNRFCKELKI